MLLKYTKQLFKSLIIILSIFTNSVLWLELESVCLFVCVCCCGKLISGGRVKFWSKGVSLIFACDDTFCYFFYLIFHLSHFSTIYCFWRHPTMDKPTLNNVGVWRGGSVAGHHQNIAIHNIAQFIMSLNSKCRPLFS